MSDELKRAREVVEMATPGPLRAEAGALRWWVRTQPGYPVGESCDGRDARAFALLGSIAPALLDVADAADVWRALAVNIEAHEMQLVAVDQDTAWRVFDAIDALRAAIRDALGEP